MEHGDLPAAAGAAKDGAFEPGLGGPNAVIRVDSFEGGQLPPKAQIKSIHVTRDQFAAETPQPGSTFVDVITQPGVGPIRGSATASFRDGGLSAVSAF